MEVKSGREEEILGTVSNSIILLLPNTCALTRVSGRHTKVYFILDSHKIKEGKIQAEGSNYWFQDCKVSTYSSLSSFSKQRTYQRQL